MIVKSQAEMTERILSSVQSRIGVNATGAGTIMQTFTEVIVEEFYDFYEQLDVLNSMVFLSTSSGYYVDLIGELLGCKREATENDEVYKSRIRKQVYTVAGGNLAAIRLKALNVSGVADIEIQEFSNGPGSFTCYVYGDGTASNAYIVEGVRSAIEAVKAYGIEIDVKSPKQLGVSIGLQIIFKDGIGAAEQRYIKEDAGTNIELYINQLTKGEGLVLNEVIEQVMKTSDKILDCEIDMLQIDGKERFIGNVNIGSNDILGVETIEVG